MERKEKFIDSLSEYLKADTEKQKRDIYLDLVTEYPNDVEEHGRTEFYPELNGRDKTEERGFLVAPPESLEEPFHDRLSDYLAEEDAVEQLTILAELQDRYDYEHVGPLTYRFFPFGGSGVEFSAPSLESFVDSFNELEDHSLDYETVEAFLRGQTKQYGDFRNTVLEREDGVVRLDEGSEDTSSAELVEKVEDVISLRDLFEFYERNPESEATFDRIRDIFHDGSDGYYEIFHDPVRDEVALFDFRIFDFQLMSVEEAEEVLEETKVSDSEDNAPEEIIDEFMRSLQDDED